MFTSHGALIAYAPHFHLQLLNLTDLIQRLRNLQVVERIADNIHRQPAPGADEVMMPMEVGIESRAIVMCSERVDQSQFLQQPQRAVNRVLGYGRNPFADPLENAFRIRMIADPGNLPEYLATLMGQLDIRIPADGLEVLHPFFDILPVDFRVHSPESPNIPW